MLVPIDLTQYEPLAFDSVLHETTVFRLHGQDRWEPVYKKKIGTRPDYTKCEYMQVCIPIGYRVRKPDEIIRPDKQDKYWSTNNQNWKPASLKQVGLSVGRRLVICLDKSAQCAVPANHRQLYPNERLRPLDKTITAEHSFWQDVTPRQYNQPVPAATDENGYTRCCRPIRTDTRCWYVSALGQGKPNATGSITDPFDTVKNARRYIDTVVADALGHAPQGLVLDTAGNFLYAYDPPLATTGIEQEMSARRPNAHLLQEFPTLPELAASGERVVESVKRNAVRKLPHGYYQLGLDNITRPGDLWFGPKGHTTTGKITFGWLRIPEQLIGTPVIPQERIFARKIMTAQHLARLQKRCRLLQQQLLTVENMLGSLADELY